ncbi:MULTISPECIES: hypothetical protein [unclassified Mycobacterium]|uniref:hypothetical protein n=1 Tax=unclassified Mycobacterium TaxID=2642494 RepID=UPI0029C8654D|nr:MULTISPECIES: hypothetical protein [unclassified Mycobacterium]
MNRNSPNVLTRWINAKSVGTVVAVAAVAASAVLVVYEDRPIDGTVTVAKNAVMATNHQPYTTPSVDVRSGGVDMNGSAATPQAGS